MAAHKALSPGIEHIAIVGLGLIGGSIARGLRKAGFAGCLSGAVADRDDADRALELQLVDRCHSTIEPAVAEADLIVIAVPPGAVADVLRQTANTAPMHAIVTDTGSSKTSVVEAARHAFDDRLMRRFVPGHPIAGTENNGLEAGFAELFTRRRVIVTPADETDPQATAVIESLWHTLGAHVTQMSVAHHDRVLAATSHLPHVLAYTLVDTLADMAEQTEIFEYAAGGFADFTRIASSDPTLWRDIVRANRTPVLETIDAFIANLQGVRRAIAEDESAHLDRVFNRAKTARDNLVSPQRKDGL